MADTDLIALEDLAAKVRKSLHWAVFLLTMMGLILIIDLQLKKSIARQAVYAAQLLTEAVTGEARQSAAPPADSGGDAGGAGVGGTPGMAASPDSVEDPVPDPAADGMAGPPQRTRRDGGRTGRAG